MILMVTNRRPVGGAYSDQEQQDGRADCLYGHIRGLPGSDGFAGTGQRGFMAALLREPQRLRDQQAVDTPKIGIYIPGRQKDWQASIDELVDLHAALTSIMGYEPVLIGFSWVSSSSLSTDVTNQEDTPGSVAALTHFLGAIDRFLGQTERSCFSVSFCIAHAHGAYLLHKGLAYFVDLPGARVGRRMFDETILFAPDLVDIALNGNAPCISRFSRRVHVYYCQQDKAFADLGARHNGANVLGHHVADPYSNLPANVVMVNAEKYANPVSVRHEDCRGRRGEPVSVYDSYRYHPDILADVSHVLSRVNEARIPTRLRDPLLQIHSGNHYRLV